MQLDFVQLMPRLDGDFLGNSVTCVVIPPELLLFLFLELEMLLSQLSIRMPDLSIYIPE